MPQIRKNGLRESDARITVIPHLTRGSLASQGMTNAHTCDSRGCKRVVSHVGLIALACDFLDDPAQHAVPEIRICVLCSGRKLKWLTHHISNNIVWSRRGSCPKRLCYIV